MMDHEHVLGMVCGYFLSRFNERAYSTLGFGTQAETHLALGQALGVPDSSIKLWRDEFDPVHENPRKGWHKRDLYPSRRRTIEVLGDLNYEEISELIRVILDSPRGQPAANIVNLIASSAEAGDDDRGRAHGLRGPTGIMAERAFVQFFRSQQEPVPGTLLDRRYEECGFDFEIEGSAGNVFIEVKGLAEEKGGITFTDKEWRTARELSDSYFLALVRNVASEPEVVLFRNPSKRFEPQLRSYTVLKINWTLSGSDLNAEQPSNSHG